MCVHVCGRREQAGVDAARAVGVEREQGLAWLSGVRDGAHLLYLHQLVSNNPNLIAYQVRGARRCVTALLLLSCTTSCVFASIFMRFHLVALVQMVVYTMTESDD